MRIAITGPESSGKTTLAKLLAQKLNGVFIPEFAREYLIRQNCNYIQKDLDSIAKGQLKLWQACENNLLIADTDLSVIYIWSKYKYNSVSDYIEKSFSKQIDDGYFEYYILCTPDTPWEDDVLRENPDNRDQLMNLYIQELDKRNVPYTIVKGTNEERLNSVILEINKKN